MKPFIDTVKSNGSKETGVIDWFLRRTTEQLRQEVEHEAEQHPDRLDELRSKISAFLNTINIE